MSTLISGKISELKKKKTPILADSSHVKLIRSWRAPIAFSIFTALCTVLFIGFSNTKSTTFALSQSKDIVQLANIVLPVKLTGMIVCFALFIMTIVAFYFLKTRARLGMFLTISFPLVAMIGFLTWAASGGTIPVPGLLLGSLSLAIPLIFGSLGGVLCERVGVINIAIEAQFLAGAFTSAIVASVTKQPLLGLISAGCAGVLVGSVLAIFSMKYFVDQVIVGVVLNVLVIGLTNFLFSKVLAPHAETLNSPPVFEHLPIPVLSEIPIIGPVLFRQTIVVYLMYVIVAVVFFALFYTRWGLRLRAVGEHPQAADTVGIRVNKTRFLNVSLAGAIAGIGGSFFTLGSVGLFNKEMTAGAGFIALAAVIFGKWDPIKATLAALLFGFAANLQTTLSVLGSPVPSEFMLMLPYLVTIFAVAGLVGKVKGPAAAGKPYRKA